MSLLLAAVCTDSQLSEPQREDRAERVIGEILPHVLARYGVFVQSGSETLPPVVAAAESPRRAVPERDAQSRVARFGGVWNR